VCSVALAAGRDGSCPVKALAQGGYLSSSELGVGRGRHAASTDDDAVHDGQVDEWQQRHSTGPSGPRVEPIRSMFVFCACLGRLL
jgi:hypothetical protein